MLEAVEPACAGASPMSPKIARKVYDKLHVHSKSQAVAKALKERLLPKNEVFVKNLDIAKVFLYFANTT